MPDDQLDVVAVTHGSLLITKPEAPGKSTHKIDGPPRDFGRDGNTDRIAGGWFFDFHLG